MNLPDIIYQRDILSTMFRTSLSIRDAAVADPVPPPTTCCAKHQDALPLPRMIGTVAGGSRSLERMIMFESSAAVMPPSTPPPRKRVTFAVPDLTTGDQNSSLPVTPRSSPLRKRRKFQRRNSKTPAMLIAAVTEFQAQQLEHQPSPPASSSFRDEEIDLADNLLAAMLQRQDHAFCLPPAVPWTRTLGDSSPFSGLPISGTRRNAF